MAISSSLIANISLGGIGLVTTGGLVGGGYLVLQNDPKPANELLKVRKRTLLSFDNGADEDAWKINWGKYVDNNIPKPPKPTPKPKDDEPLPPAEAETPKRDVWKLEGWEQLQKNRDSVPPIFKTTCKTKSESNVNGIWSAVFKEVEEYCTKEIAEED